MSPSITFIRAKTVTFSETVYLTQLNYIVRGVVSGTVLGVVAYADDAVGLARAMYPAGCASSAIEIIDTRTGLNAPL